MSDDARGTEHPGGFDEGERLFDFHPYTSPRLLWKTRVGRTFYGKVSRAADFSVSEARVQIMGRVLDADTGLPLGEEETSLPSTFAPVRAEYACGRGFVSAYDEGGGVRWSHRLRKGYRDPHLAFDRGVVYVGGVGDAGFDPAQPLHATDGYLLSLDAETGDLRWMYATPGEVSSPPVAAGGRVYVGDGDRESRAVYCLSASPASRLGQCFWRYELEGLAL